jgi:hypothetical protein
MAHGYIGEGYGIDGGQSDRDNDRERGWREHDRDWRGRSEDWRDRERDRDRDRDRGMMFGRHERDWSDEDRWSNREYGQGGFRGDYEENRRSFSASPDDHYRSWRDRHMSELDRDYQDYCREREQRFHQDFDAWRQQRHANYQPLRTGMTNSGISHDPSGQVQAETETETEGMAMETDPTDAATLGTNSSAETRSGRGRR